MELSRDRKSEMEETVNQKENVKKKWNPKIVSMPKQDLRKAWSTLIAILMGRDTAGEGTMSVKTDE
jgi:hypothetical protein